MYHNIITIMTTAAVAFHAMLGCCAHHSHSCDSHESGLVEVVHEAKNHCSHVHHDHSDDESHGEDVDKDCNHQHGGGDNQDCDEANCNFASVNRSNDLELMLAFTVLCQALGDTAHADAQDGLLSLHSTAETPPDPLVISDSARAITQVWRL